ncbi:MAG: hypothetical protein BroJett018_39330 [Chloroflexota bacterium]|nr:MAG: hypothetical protein BroJett018_39330 [Chloroflexota bacterium]
MLRPYEMDTDAVPIALIMPFPPIPDKSLALYPVNGEGKKALLTPFLACGEGMGLACM